ncbi:histidine kinase [Sphingobacterium sp. UT-1RO-CII-1]|uniref:sensor histidine kinase n=1 Tax=Sphingobacterium sp. UT-1RO-CII-1 TaxID=2995225 RepID=UPI00227D3C61|nr:histidine kinase [Sphingobacterium sp. UT-1RO-CII-1]MCY4780387.1 histidine kinase [Sphingobacterium sp. UT-1RO-CII-1]
MKKIVLIFISFLTLLSAVYAQKGINHSIHYAAGGRLNMHVDSGANNVYYNSKFPNQPNTSFNYLPEVNHVSVLMYFRKKENPQNFRYTILEDDTPLVVNKPVNKEQLHDVIRKDIDWKDEVLDSTSLGVFPLKGKTITILIYSVENPLNIQKTIFYGKPIPRAKIEVLSKRFATEKGVSYSSITDLKEVTDLVFTEKDDELTIVKDLSEIDYLYSTSIKDKKTNKIIFESTSWRYGGYLNEEGNKHLPYVKLDKSIFKKSGDYEIIIQPMIKWNSTLEGVLEYNLSPKEIEEYTTRHTLAITLSQENYTLRDLLTFVITVTSMIGLVFLFILYINKKHNKKKLAEKEQQEQLAKVQLSSIRSQLNPHFLFNALSGIQNLMNKNEVDNANKYLAKFARLTRTVLTDKELISLAQEKKLLDDYLQMEQLRFGFKYNIFHDEDLDLDNIEIPSMLLQPFVENAVKHGIAEKGHDGDVIIRFTKQENDLILTVADNGNGFNTATKSTGLGLQLSENRIALLNSIYKENHFILAIQSNSEGTKINLTLTDWL